MPPDPAPAGAPDRTDTGVGHVALLLAACAVLFLGWRFLDGLSFLSFADEATHLVAGRMLDRGAVLYRDFVDSHGPLIFALTQGYGFLFGWSHNNNSRLLQVACGVLATVSLVLSPVARRRDSRAVALLVGCGLLATVWLRQGLYLVSFYPLGGALASIALTGFVGGACFGRFPGRMHAATAGFATALLAATAYSFLPTIVCFALAACWAAWSAGERKALGWFLAGGVVGLLGFTGYMLRFADLHGYLSYHLAENQTVYSRYISFGWPMFRHGLTPSLLSDNRARTLGLFCLLLALGGSALRGVRRGPLCLSVLGVLLLNARGVDDFQNGSFLWAAITLLALVAAHAVETVPVRTRVWALLCCAFLVSLGAGLMRGATFHPFGMTAATIRGMPRWPVGDRAEGAFFVEIRRYAGPDDRILALLYQPQLYLLADRLPMDGIYAWFPWDADYARAPRFGRGRDLCRSLQDRPPAVIVIDATPLWGYAAFTVAPCLPGILQARYRRDDAVRDIHGEMFVRRDRN